MCYYQQIADTGDSSYRAVAAAGSTACLFKHIINGHCRSLRSNYVRFLIWAKIPCTVNVYLAEWVYTNTRNNTMRKTRLFVVGATVQSLAQQQAPCTAVLRLYNTVAFVTGKCMVNTSICKEFYAVQYSKHFGHPPVLQDGKFRTLNHVYVQCDGRAVTGCTQRSLAVPYKLIRGQGTCVIVTRAKGRDC